MRVQHGAAVLGMVLRTDVPTLASEFHYLGKATLGIHAGNRHARLFKLLAILVVEFKAVAVTLLNVGYTIGFCNLCGQLL